MKKVIINYYYFNVASGGTNTIWKPTGTDRIQTDVTSIKARLGDKSNGESNDENDKYIIKLDKDTGKIITYYIPYLKKTIQLRIYIIDLSLNEFLTFDFRKVHPSIEAWCDHYGGEGS